MTKASISLSINPTYLCNLRCDFCYLTKEQLSDRKVIPTEQLMARMNEISMFRNIEHVDIYGGEISLIRPTQLEELLSVVRMFYKGKINIITNLTSVPASFTSVEIELSVSWDYLGREHYEKVFENMLSLNKEFSILILASKTLLKMNDHQFDDFINSLNKLPNLKSVEIKPYSQNQANQHPVTFQEHENWVMKWIRRSADFRFRFVNKDKIEASIRKEYSSWSDDHLYITPSAKFAVLDFDENNNEYFEELESFEDYISWAEKEKTTVSNNEFCGNCKYLGHCLSEHLQRVQALDRSCNGFKGLLEWYENERL